MRNAKIALLFDYMYWVNRRLLDAAEQLPEGGFLASSTATTRDLRATLVGQLPWTSPFVMGNGERGGRRRGSAHRV